MAGLFSSRGSDRQEPQSGKESGTSRSSSERTTGSLDNQIAGLISEHGEVTFFASLGRVVESLAHKPINESEPTWDEQIGWVNIGQFMVGDWKRRFPRVNVEGELAKAHSWLLANPKNRKRKYRRFLESWMSRAQKSAMAYNGGFTRSEPKGTGF